MSTILSFVIGFGCWTPIELEHLCLEIKQHQSGPKILFTVIYCPLNSSPVFYKFLDESMDISTAKDNEVIAVGDFNIDLLAVNGSCRLSTIFQDAGMKQFISSSTTTTTRVTRCSAALLDHVYVTHPEQIIETLVPIYGLSDHYPVCFVHKFRNLKSPKPHHDTIKYCSFKNFDKESFIYDLDTAPWSMIDIFQDVNDKLDTAKLIFNSVINQHAPAVKKRVKRKKLPPWMNISIIDCIRIRDKFK